MALQETPKHWNRPRLVILTSYKTFSNKLQWYNGTLVHQIPRALAAWILTFFDIFLGKDIYKCHGSFHPLQLIFFCWSGDRRLRVCIQGQMAFFWNTAKVVASVVFLPSRLSSFMSLSSIFRNLFFSQQSDHIFNMQILDQNTSLYFSEENSSWWVL